MAKLICNLPLQTQHNLKTQDKYFLSFVVNDCKIGLHIKLVNRDSLQLRMIVI